MTEITREQFASAVAAAVSSVYHLFRQVDRLVDELRSGLADGSEPLTPLPGTLGKLSGRSSARMMLRNEYGILFQPAPADDDDSEDEEEEDTDEVDEDDGGARKKSRPAEITPEQPLLAVRIAIYDPQKPEAAEPRIEFAVLGDWRVGGNKPVTGERFRLASYMLRRIPRAIAKGGSFATGAIVDTGALAKTAAGKKKGDARRLNCRVLVAGSSVPLYDMDKAGAVHALVEQMKAMWASTMRSNA
jgi:hypothetical protein